MIAFVIHDGICSSDEVMFAESFEAWWTKYLQKNGAHYVFEKCGEIDYENEYFGLIHYCENLEKIPADFSEFSDKPNYVSAYTVTADLELSFGG